MSPASDLRNDPRAVKVIKSPTPVQVHFADEAGTCETLEGPVRYERGDAILTGPQGERWPVRRSLFLKAYLPAPPVRVGEDGPYRKRRTETLAVQLEEETHVPVGWQADPLHGKPGDWLLQYEDGTHGIIQDQIFQETYLRAAPS